MTAHRSALAALFAKWDTQHGHNWANTKTAADQENNPEKGTPNCRIEESAMTAKETAPNSCVNNCRDLTQHLNERRG